jgi:hypothetical protein
MDAHDLFAVHRSAPGRWLLHARSDDPFLPAVVLVAAIDQPAYPSIERGADVIPFDLDRKLSRGTINNFSWRDDLLQLARLIDTLSPERDDPESFYVKKNAVSHELRRLAKWRLPS